MKVIRFAGELFITFGLVLLLFCAYELWGTSLYTQRQQQQLTQALQRRWDSRPVSTGTQGKDVAKPPYRYGDVPKGHSFAVIWIPELGVDYSFAIVEGAGTEQLKKGPGHFLGRNGTAMPGQLGNFVLSGHRTTYSAPFRQIDELEPGDPIIIETDDTWFTYRVYDTEIVDPTAIEVAAPVPFHPGTQPRKRRITLTTCHPMYTARQRLIVFGELAEARPKSAGKPPALTVPASGGV